MLEEFQNNIQNFIHFMMKLYKVEMLKQNMNEMISKEQLDEIDKKNENQKQKSYKTLYNDFFSHLEILKQGIISLNECFEEMKTNIQTVFDDLEDSCKQYSNILETVKNNISKQCNTIFIKVDEGSGKCLHYGVWDDSTVEDLRKHVTLYSIHQTDCFELEYNGKILNDNSKLFDLSLRNGKIVNYLSTFESDQLSNNTNTKKLIQNIHKGIDSTLSYFKKDLKDMFDLYLSKMVQNESCCLR